MTTGEILALSPLALLLASAPFFFVFDRGHPPDTDLATRPVSPLLSRWVREWFVWALSPLEAILVQRRVSPTHLNLFGLVLGVLAGIAYAAGLLPFAAWMVAAGGVCDILDGRVARERGITSSRGAFLDSTLDRFAEVAMFAGVGWYFRDMAWFATATLLAAGSSLLVSYTRARGEALGVSGAVGFAQRPERLVLLAVASLADPLVSRRLAWPTGSILGGAVVLIAAAALVTAAYRTWFIARALARSEEAG